MEKITVMPLSADDIYEVSEIKVNGWKKAYKGIISDSYLNSLSVDENVEIFKQCINSDNFIVALENDKVLGFCRFVYDNSFSNNIDYIDCELTALYVHPDYKRKGIGTKLFKYVLDRFNNMNKKTMILWCLTDNTDSIEFYKHMGGEIKEKRNVQIGDLNYQEVGIVYNIKELCNGCNIKQ